MASPLQTSLAHYWALTDAAGTRADTGPGTAADLSQTGTVSQGAGNLLAHAATFNGNALNYLRNASLGIATWAADFTLCFWANVTTGFSNQAFLGSGDFWISTTGFAFVASGTNLGVNLVASTGTKGVPTISTNTISTGWHFFCIRHDATAKTLTMWVDGRISRGTAYTGTVNTDTSGDVTTGLYVGLQPRGDVIDQNDPTLNPFTGRIEGLTHWSRALTELEVLALYNGGVELLKANWDTAYPDNNTIPGVDQSQLVCMSRWGNILNKQAEATIDGSAGTATTLREQALHGETEYNDMPPFLSPVLEFANVLPGFIGGIFSATGEDGYAGVHQTIAATALLPGDAAVTNLTFATASSKDFAYQDIARNDAANMSGRVVWANEGLHYNAKITPASGTKVPAIGHLQSATVDGTVTGDHLSDTTGTAFVNHQDADFWAAHAVYGYPSVQAGTAQAADVIQIGDSISSDATTRYWPTALQATKCRYVAIGSSGEAAADFARTNGGLVRRQIVANFGILAYQYGINDARAGAGFSLATFKANLWSVIAQAVAGNTRKIFLSCLTPLSGFSNVSDATTIARNSVNAYFIALTSAIASSDGSLPIVVKTWNNNTQAWVAQGTRGNQVGNWANVYIFDRVNATVENGWAASGGGTGPGSGDGTWTDIAHTDGDASHACVHPDSTYDAQIKTDISAQLAAALIDTPPSGQTTYTITGASLSPTSATVAGGAAQQFTPTVTGAGTPPQTGTWQATAGTIDTNGLFTAPAATNAVQTITITFTAADGTTTAMATVTVPANVVPPPTPTTLNRANSRYTMDHLNAV